MSDPSSTTAKPTPEKSTTADPTKATAPPALLEEDDEFEDFPVEGTKPSPQIFQIFHIPSSLNP
jgi:hypothetical protein